MSFSTRVWAVLVEVRVGEEACVWELARGPRYAQKLVVFRPRPRRETLAARSRNKRNTSGCGYGSTAT
eukprot:9996096-Alexandrium_andersonii.AAC.1